MNIQHNHTALSHMTATPTAASHLTDLAAQFFYESRDVDQSGHIIYQKHQRMKSQSRSRWSWSYVSSEGNYTAAGHPAAQG